MLYVGSRICSWRQGNQLTPDAYLLGRRFVVSMCEAAEGKPGDDEDPQIASDELNVSRKAWRNRIEKRLFIIAFRMIFDITLELVRSVQLRVCVCVKVAHMGEARLQCRSSNIDGRRARSRTHPLDH